MALIGAGGCAPKLAISTQELEVLATRYVTAAATYRDNALLRAQAVEALQEVQGEDAVSWFREALRDEHSGVRFAACMALGGIRHKGSESLLRLRLEDADASVRVAAMYALRRLGGSSDAFVKEWSEILLTNPDPRVRRNAATALGRLGEPGAIALLKKVAQDDTDPGVQVQALEAMSLLGDKRSIAKMVSYATGGYGDRQAFALATLGRCGDRGVIDTLRYGLRKSPYLESRLAAAEALALYDIDDGYALAVRSLAWNSPNPNLTDDPPENQVLRVRTLAAMALGSIGNPDALEPLRQRMVDDPDARVQLAAATAILRILRGQRVPPFGDPARRLAPSPGGSTAKR